jgi:hypothetical protein
MKQSPSWETSSHSARKILRLFMEPDESNLTYHPIFYKIYSNPVVISTFRSSKWSLPFRFSDQNFVRISYLSHVFYMPCRSHPPWLDHRNTSYIICEIKASRMSWVEYPSWMETWDNYTKFPFVGLKGRDRLKYLHRGWEVKVKVKLSLCFNWAPRHEGVLGSGCISPRILDLGNRWRWVVSFTPRPLWSTLYKSLTVQLLILRSFERRL